MVYPARDTQLHAPDPYPAYDGDDESAAIAAARSAEANGWCAATVELNWRAIGAEVANAR